MKRLLPIILVAAALAGGIYVGYTRRAIRAEISGPAISITFLDSGLGGGAVVRTPEGNVLVIDPGSDETAEKLTDYLRRTGVKSFSILITNPSSDRGSAVRTLIENCRVLKLFRGKRKGASRGWRRSIEAAIEKHVPQVVLFGGMKIALSASTKMEVLSPPKGMLDGSDSQSDDDTLVIRVIYGKKSFVFLSDATKETEEWLIQADNDLHSSVLNIAGGVTLELLSQVRPEMCVVSSGKSLTKDELSRIRPANTGATLYTTDEYGTIRLVTDGRSIIVETGSPR